MKAVLAIFELLVGLTSGFAVLFMLASLAGISTPVWGAQFVLYWGGLFAGPLLLVIGASLTLAGTAQKPAAMLTMLGSAILTCWIINLAGAVLTERTKPVLALLVAGSVLLILASDLAAYKIFQLVSRCDD